MHDQISKTGGWYAGRRQPWLALLRPSWIWLLGTGGAVLTIVFAMFLRQREDAVAERLFLLNAQKRSEAIKNLMNDRMVAVRALDGLFESSREVDPQEFRKFAERLLADIRGVRLLAWGARVGDEHREAFERATAAVLNSDFVIRDWHDGQWIVAPRRPAYAPLIYVSSTPGLTIPAGWDVLTSDELDLLLRHAEESGKLTAAAASGNLVERPPARLPQRREASSSPDAGVPGNGAAITSKSDGPTGTPSEEKPLAKAQKAPSPEQGRTTHARRPLIAVIVPLRAAPKFAAAPELPWSSFVVGVFSAEEIVTDAINFFEPAGVDVWLAAESSAGAIDLLTFRPSAWRTEETNELLFPPVPGEDLQYRDRFEAGGRNWLVICEAIDDYYSRHRSWRPLNVLLGGWALSALLTAYLLVVMRQSGQIEQWAAQRAAELETVSNAALDAVVIMDADGRVAHWNPAAERMFGYRRDEILGRSIHEVLVPESRRAEALDGVRRFSRTGQGEVVGKVVEMEAVRRDGALVPIELSVAAMKQPDGWWAVAVVRDIAHRKHAEQLLLRERALLRQLLDMHERERQLIGYEIHDGLTQQIAGALMKSQALASALKSIPQAEEKAAELAAMLKEALAESRQLIAGLRPALLNEAGPAAAIEVFVEQQNRQSRSRVEFTNRARTKRFAPPIEAALFRIVQEAVHNALRYSQSDRIEVELSETDGNIEARVRDRGVGFDPERVEHGHFGLQGIRERARLLGGVAEILSRPGEGTMVRVRFPMDAAGIGAERPPASE